MWLFRILEPSGWVNRCSLCKGPDFSSYCNKLFGLGLMVWQPLGYHVVATFFWTPQHIVVLLTLLLGMKAWAMYRLQICSILSWTSICATAVFRFKNAVCFQKAIDGCRWGMLLSKDSVQSCFDYDGANLQISLHICRTTSFKPIVHGALLQIHPRSVQSLWDSLSQLLLVRYLAICINLRVAVQQPQWQYCWPWQSSSQMLLSWMGSYGHFSQKPSRGWGTASRPHLEGRRL